MNKNGYSAIDEQKAFGKYMDENTCTTMTTQPPQVCTLKALSEAMKEIDMMPDITEMDKSLGAQAAIFKLDHSDSYKKMSDADKSLIDNAIERASYIVRQESIIIK